MILKALTQILPISMFEYSPTFTQTRLPSYERARLLFFKPNSIFVGIFLSNIISPQNISRLPFLGTICFDQRCLLLFRFPQYFLLNLQDLQVLYKLFLPDPSTFHFALSY